MNSGRAQGLVFLVWVIFFFGCESKGDHYSAKFTQAIEDTSRHNKYTWIESYSAGSMLLNRIPVPEGYERTKEEKGSFADWLRHLPLKPGAPSVLLYNGSLKQNQTAQFAVVNIDVGTEDLQQCADAVMRLKAEYHFSKKESGKIHFKFTSGDNAEYARWEEGYRPVIKGNKVSWVKSANPDHSYKSFRAYLKQVFMYAGTSSLSQELEQITPEVLRPGDVFIHGGFPGHAVIVLDVAVHKTSGEKLFVVAQSYMPAQDIHILKNKETPGSPWYSINFGDQLDTPEWSFERIETKRFK